MSAAAAPPPPQNMQAPSLGFATSPDRSYSEHDQSQELSENQWRALAKIVRDVGPNLSPDEELGDLAAAEAAVNAKDAERTEILDKMQEELRQLSRQLSQAASAAQRPTSHPTAAEHEAQARSLEQQQIVVGKQLREEEATVAKRETELSKWKNDKDEVGKIQVGESGWTDGKIIRLKLLQDAGFALVTPQDGSGQAKVLIRNDAKEDVHSVPIDKSRSKAYTANLIWNLASE